MNCSSDKIEISPNVGHYTVDTRGWSLEQKVSWLKSKIPFILESSHKDISISMNELKNMFRHEGIMNVSKYEFSTSKICLNAMKSVNKHHFYDIDKLNECETILVFFECLFFSSVIDIGQSMSVLEEKVPNVNSIIFGTYTCDEIERLCSNLWIVSIIKDDLKS